MVGEREKLNETAVVKSSSLSPVTEGEAVQSENSGASQGNYDTYDAIVFLRKTSPMIISHSSPQAFPTISTALWQNVMFSFVPLTGSSIVLMRVRSYGWTGYSTPLGIMGISSSAMD